ncbi:MAG: biotin/lipoyl-containing protein, partial [Mobilicoccus sp.]|nr:biotin/lipoyl-containing protein [Mobilicoccus sp.]
MTAHTAGPLVRTLAVLDEGEPVARVVAAVADLGRADGVPVTSVVAHLGSAPWYAREADELLDLSAAVGGEGEDFTERVVAALVAAGIDAVWPGRLVTRHTDLAPFVEACIEAGLRVAGPLPATLRRLRDLDEVAASLDLPRSHGPTPRSRLLDIDVVTDGSTVLTLPPRDVLAVEGEHLVLSEYPAAGVGDETVAALDAAVHRLVGVLGYTGGATVRFRLSGDGTIGLVDVDVLARPEQTLLDESLTSALVQMRVAALTGRPLPTELPAADGHAIAVGILARDLSHADSHVVRVLDLPAGVGVRADVSARVGDRVGELVTTIGAWGRDRDQARQRLVRAVERTTIVLDGAITSRSEILLLLSRPEFVAGDLDETWYAERVASADLVAEPDPVALVAAAVESYQAEFASVRATFLASAARGRPQRPEDVGTRFTLDYRGADYVCVVERRSSTRYHVSLTHGETTVEVDCVVDVLGEHERRLTCAGRKHRVVAAERGASIRLEIDGLAHTVQREDGMAVRTERPALVADLHVAVGDTVAVGQPLATLESMKMLSTVTSPHEGVVASIAVLPNTQVERGATLLRVRGETTGPAPGGRTAESAVDLSVLAGEKGAAETGGSPDAAEVYRRLRDYLLGYDLTPGALAALLAEQKSASGEAELLAVEDSLLDVYADLAALYRPRTEGDMWHDVEVDTLAETGDTQEYFLAFLQWMDADRAGLPDSYRERLARALARYGIQDLAPGPELDEATLWMFRSFARVPSLSGAITTILERRLRSPEAVRGALGAGARARLERLARSAEGRAPGVAALARDLAFTLFEEPTLEAAAEAARAPMLDILAGLAGGSEGVSDEDKAAAVDALVAYPHPLRAQLLQSWFDSDEGDTDLREVLLTVAVQRYYRHYDLRDVGTATYDGVSVGFADYDVDGRRVHLVTTFSSLLDVYELGATVQAHLADVGLLEGPEAEATDIVVGVLSWRRSPVKTFDELVTATHAGLQHADVGRRVARFDLTVTSRAGTGKEHTRTQHVSFTQDGAGAWLEMPIYRNLHPSMAERLGIWRLENFDLERLASPEEVYLFLGVAKKNPSDRRLFALVEARDITRVENEEGRASYPGLE